MTNKKVCEKVNDILSKESSVIAIFNNGSSTVGLETKESDMDFVVIINKELEISKLKKLLRENTNPMDGDNDTPYEINNKRIDCSFFTKDFMDNLVQNFYMSKESFLKNQHLVKHKIIDAESVYDPDCLLDGYKGIIEAYPEEFMTEVYKDAINRIKENLYYWENHGFRNEFQFSYESWEIIEDICVALYSKNRRLFMLPFKRLHNDLKELKPNVEKEMYSLIRKDNSPKVIKEKISVVKKILEKFNN